MQRTGRARGAVRNGLAVILPAVVVLSLLNAPPALGLSGIETSSVTKPIAPGLRLTEFDRFTPDGWIRGDVLTADLSEPALRPKYLSPPVVAQRAPLSEQAAEADVVAGINGDFFDIDNTEAPLGVGLAEGRLRQSPVEGHDQAASFTADAARMMRVFLDAHLTRSDGSTTPITELNSPQVRPDGIALYTSLWGGASRVSAVGGAERVKEVELAGGVVKRVADAPIDGPMPQDTVRLLGRGKGADVLGSMRPGERVGVNYQPRTDGETPTVAIGGEEVLLRDGAIPPVDGQEKDPRSAVGFSADGKRMWMATIDGRQQDSAGVTKRELAELFRSWGADDALNLDGGGSSTLLARQRGDDAPRVQNSPSGGQMRPVPNGIGLATAAGSGRLDGFRVGPAAEGPQSKRVLSGLTRTMRAAGYDEVGAPVPARPRWSTSQDDAGDMHGPVFHARNPGRTEVKAKQSGAAGKVDLHVLGPLERLDTSKGQIRLPEKGATGRFQVLGYDSDGFETWVEPADVQLEYDPEVLRIVPGDDGFKVTPLAEVGTTVTAKVGGHETHFGVSAGSQPHRLSPMDEVTGWKASVQPDVVKAKLGLGEGHAGTPGVTLDYALTGSNETRAAYVDAAPEVALPKGTQKLGVWVNGDGHGGWLRAKIVDRAGVSSTLDLARNVDWTGWRYVETVLPEGVGDDLRLQQLYVVEPDAARQYEGRLVFDDLTASVATNVDVPPNAEVEDPSVVQDGALPPGTGSKRVAVVSDAQFTADQPDGPLVGKARRSLREALAAEPDMIVINGDFVDRGTEADFDLARRVIESELQGRVPWRYVPGNHETYGTGDVREFEAEFGQPHGVVDSGTTRFVFLDTSLGTVRAGGFEQVRMLRRALDSAANDPGVRSVSVFMHHPVEDPTPSDTSELEDPKEADLFTRWLTEFEQESGKPAAVVTGHAGVFHGSTVDGVPYLINGNAGKAPALAPENGGFTGTSLLRIDPSAEEPIRWQTRPHVDELTLSAPNEVAVRQQASVEAEVRQGDRVVPVDYPVSGDWSSSANVHIGPVEDAGPGKVAAFDPETGILTGLRPGAADLSVMVNGVTRTVQFDVVTA